MALIVADKNGRTDGAAYEFLKNIKTDIPLVLVSRMDGFVFNDVLLSLVGKKWVLFDYTELGWNHSWEYGHTWGVNTHKFDFLRGEEWKKFDDFFIENPPRLIFQRELLADDYFGSYNPIEYPNLSKPYPIETREQFNSRPISLMYYWGRSNEIRVQTHGDIWKGASQYNYSVCDNLYYFNDFMKEEKGKKVVSLNIPHYGRIDISVLLSINSGSKLSLSLPGNGIKCFRSTGEAPVNSVMVCMEDDLAWSYEFEHGESCIKIKKDEPILPAIMKALERDDLYDIYLKGMEVADKYRAENYINNYINPILNSI